MTIFDDLESEVRSYCRLWPTVFDRAAGGILYDVDGAPYLDFFAGAGALNYGHNHPAVIEALVRYLRDGGVLHSLDMHTAAKREFLEAMRDHVLGPRGLDYRVMFTGPTGTNAVEAALKAARNTKGRTGVISFTNAFHGMTLGSLALTGNGSKRDAAGVSLSSGGTVLPYCDYLAEPVTLDLLERLLGDASSGIDLPAAVIVETIQGEGGVNVATTAWLRRLATICRRYDVLLIVDDIQAGCGRTGTFFSFEEAGIVPDIVTLSKSLSASGLPLAVTLLRPELDSWAPGAHNGTFRGNNAAFVTAAAGLRSFWSDGTFEGEIRARAEQMERSARQLAVNAPELIDEVRGRGMLWGLSFRDPAFASRVAREAFDRHLLVETCGSNDEVVKLLPPLVLDSSSVEAGFDRLDDAITAVAGSALGVVA